MASKLTSFEQENALLFGKLEELLGQMEVFANEKKSSQQKILGLQFERDNLRKENTDLEKELVLLKKEKQKQDLALKNLNSLEKQNFSIRNKIAKIAENIESQEDQEENWQDLIETLIVEVDKCIELIQS